MERIKAKDSQALSKLYDIYSGFLFGLILSILKKREEAEDLLQEVFVQIWRKAPSFDHQRGNVYSWIVTLTRNKAIDRIRSKAYKTSELESEDVDSPTIHLATYERNPLDATILAERKEFVKQALQKIPESQREVIELAYFGGMTQSEISDELGYPLGTVKTRMRQGMIKLRHLLEKLI